MSGRLQSVGSQRVGHSRVTKQSSAQHYQFYKGLPQSTSSSPGDELIRWNLITLFKVDNMVSYRNRKIFELKYVSADFMIYLDLVEEFRYKSKDSFRVKINFINKI